MLQLLIKSVCKRIILMFIAVIKDKNLQINLQITLSIFTNKYFCVRLNNEPEG